ncbi:MAG: DUF6029 family protein [Candidatus Marinimicrobia bacterium]|nr:DUF6029 family protein [Candidatus Neomarinimicrobiota bacterium]
MRCFLSNLLLVTVGLTQISFSGNAYIGYGKSENDFNFSEDRIDLNAHWKNWNGWMQLEFGNPPELGRNVKGLRKLRLEYSKDSYTIKLGDLYEFWGRGLLLNMVDDQSIDLDTGLRGGLVNWSNNRFQFELLGGTHEIWRLSNQVTDFDNRIPNYGIENTVFAGLAGLNYNQWSGGFQFLKAVEDHPNPGTKQSDTINHQMYSFILSYFGESSDFNIELVNKDVDGLGMYGDGNIYFGTWSFGYSYKNYHFADLSPFSRWDFVNHTGGAFTLQQMPTVYKEHNTNLLGKITHQMDFNDELGFHIRAEGPLFDETMLSIHYYQSSRHNEWVMNDNWEWQKKGGVNGFPSTNPLYNPFKEFFTEINGYAFLNRVYFMIGFASTKDVIDIYSNHVYGDFKSYNYEFLEAQTIPTHFTYRFNNAFSVDILFEYQEKKKGVNSFSNNPAMGNIPFTSIFLKDKQINRFVSFGLAKSPKWSATLSMDYSNTEEWIVVADDRKHNAIEKALNNLWDTSLTWANFEFVYNLSEKTRLTLSYGSLRGGVYCSNGVCRYIQPFENGYKLGIISSF